jgi:lysine 2,3-aminomutase
MGGGGKRDAHSFEHYDRENGVAVFTSPAVKPGVKFLYFDPLATLSESVRERWLDPGEREDIIQAALSRAN